MPIRNINGTINKDEGFVNPVDCPVCSQNVAMTVLVNKDNVFVSMLKKSPNETYMALCPKCESFFSVNENFIKERDNGTAVLMTKEDLSLIVKGKKCDIL